MSARHGHVEAERGFRHAVVDQSLFNRELSPVSAGCRLHNDWY
jgi:hypothetical protein